MTHAVSHSVDSLVYNMEQKVNGGAAARPKATPHPPPGPEVCVYVYDAISTVQILPSPASRRV